MTTAVLLSGGMDSIALAYWQRPHHVVTIDYGQKARLGELRAATAAAAAMGIAHEVITVDIRQLGSGDMAGTDPSPIATVPEWWPYRNQMLVTLAAMRGLALGITHLQIGTVSGDDKHADGRLEFVTRMNDLLQVQEGSMAFEAPAIVFSAVQLIRHASVPLDVLAWAHSCHVSDYACGWCRGCRKHFETMQALGYEPY